MQNEIAIFDIILTQHNTNIKMISIFQEEVLDQLLKRVDALGEDSMPKWGKMNVVLPR